nr:hypothetical protein [Novosphingobium sp.]
MNSEFLKRLADIHEMTGAGFETLGQMMIVSTFQCSEKVMIRNLRVRGRVIDFTATVFVALTAPTWAWGIARRHRQANSLNVLKVRTISRLAREV